jgi:cbb3-type cytochrome oxidase maturation protein
MSILVVLIIVSLVVAGGFLAAFLWAVRSGQFDDAHSPSVRILEDETKTDSTKENR